MVEQTGMFTYGKAPYGRSFITKGLSTKLDRVRQVKKGAGFFIPKKLMWRTTGRVIASPEDRRRWRADFSKVGVPTTWLSPKNKKFLSNLKKGSGFEKIE